MFATGSLSAYVGERHGKFLIVILLALRVWNNPIVQILIYLNNFPSLVRKIFNC